MPRALLVLLAAAIVACDPSPTAPQSGLLGQYELTRLSSDIRGVTTDHLAAGARLDIELREDGTASLDLFVPAGGSSGDDLIEKIETRWFTQRLAVSSKLVITTLWLDAESAVVSSGWRIENATLFADPPSCSMEHWEPNIADCRINAELSKTGDGRRET